MLSNLSKREIHILIFGTLFLALFFTYQLGIAPMFENQYNLSRIFNEKQTALEEMIQLEKQFFQVSNRFELSLKTKSIQQKGFSLFSFLDLQARQGNVKENVAYMKPFSKNLEGSDLVMATVKVKLTQVYLQELIDFLYRIESAVDGVDITSLSITRQGKEKQTLDVVIETQALMDKKEQESKPEVLIKNTKDHGKN
ncbi:MAG: hypothetical protein ABIJ59_17680 [Pseudomonadota bacterium]